MILSAHTIVYILTEGVSLSLQNEIIFITENIFSLENLIKIRWKTTITGEVFLLYKYKCQRQVYLVIELVTVMVVLYLS